MSKTEAFEKLDRIQELRFNKLYRMPYPSRECVERWDKRYKKMCFNVLESFAKERAIKFVDFYREYTQGKNFIWKITEVYDKFIKQTLS